MPLPVRGTRAYMVASNLTAALARHQAGSVELGSCCTELVAAVGSRSTVERRIPAWLPRARDRLSDLSARPVSLESLSRSLAIHPVHLTRTFRKFYGCTPGQYLRAIRMRRAAEMIVTRQRSLAEIAACCGFTDQSHLTNELRRGCGLSPAALRARTR